MTISLQQSFFIGRDEQIALYHSFLSQSSPWLLLVTGMPGCGKSFFLKHMQEHASEDTSTVYLDFADISLQTDPLTLLSELSWGCAQFCNGRAVELFHQQLQESRQQLAQTYTKQLKDISDQIQKEALDSTNLESLLSDNDKDAIEAAVLDSIRDALLTQLATLSPDKHLVVIFDTCEWLTAPTGRRVGTWLLEQFLPYFYQQYPCHLVMACRTPIPLSETLERQSTQIELRELEKSAVTAYVHQIHMQVDVGDHIYHITRGHPLCFAIMTALWQEEHQEGKETANQEQDLARLEEKYSEHALVELVQERLDQRLPSPYREWTHYGILLRRFDKTMLRKVFPELSCSNEDYDHFVHYLYVQAKEPDWYTIHELLREVLFEIIRRQEPDKWQRYHQRAYDFYKKLHAPQSYGQYYHAVALDEIHGLKQWHKELRKASTSKQEPQSSIEQLFESATDPAMQLGRVGQALYEGTKRFVYEPRVFLKEFDEGLEKEVTSYREKGDQAAATDIEEARHQIEDWRTKDGHVRPWWRLIIATVIITTIIFNFVAVFPLFYPSPNQVTSLADSGPGSLRQAIASPGSTITLSPQLQGTIVLGSDLDIKKNVTVLGSDTQSTTISNNHNQNVHIHIGTHATVVFVNFTFANSLVLKQSFLENEGKLTLNKCHVQNNISYENGGGITNQGGGAIRIVDSLITQNFASNDGGGISNSNGTLTITGSTISSNTAFDNGGGIYSLNGSVSFSNTQILRNQVLRNANSQGGGIAALDSQLHITGSTITQNWTPGTGGGISILGSQATMSNSVVSGNMANSGRELAVENNSENNKISTINLTNLILPPYEDHPTYYIGNGQDKIEDIIKGKLTNNSSNPKIESIPSDKSLVGAPAPTTSPPESSSDYIGNIDLGQYCQTHSYPSSNSTNPLVCIDIHGTQHIIDPLQVCQERYPDKNITTDRLAYYFDPASWQCYTNARLLGLANMAENVDAFCRYNGTLDIANNPRKTAYDWACLHQGGMIGHYPIHLDNFLVGLSVTDLCRFVYANKIAPTATVMDRLTNYNNPEGWECWELT